MSIIKCLKINPCLVELCSKESSCYIQGRCHPECQKAMKIVLFFQVDVPKELKKCTPQWPLLAQS